METYEPPSLNPVQKIALILELPAMFLAIPIGALLLPQNETAWMYLSIPLVPLVWYAIGRWLDGLLGYIARLRVPAILRGLLSTTALGVLMVSMAGVTPLNHHRTPETSWVLTSMALWSGLCISMMLFSPDRATRDCCYQAIALRMRVRPHRL